MWQVHVIIQEIFLNGAVHKDGRLFPGDQLVAVRQYPVLCLYIAVNIVRCMNFNRIFLALLSAITFYACEFSTTTFATAGIDFGDSPFFVITRF